jgi:hypothetical protein
MSAALLHRKINFIKSREGLTLVNATLTALTKKATSSGALLPFLT